MNNITYTETQALLTNYDADQDAAEAHGIATGLLCLDERVSVNTWINELFKNPAELSKPDLVHLTQFFSSTKADLIADDFRFNLFLPDDDTLLSEQSEAVCHWCRGFLLGIGRTNAKSIWQGNSGEILKDIIEFTKLDPDVHSEEDEQALVEIIEYLRSAVLLFRDDLRIENGQPH